MIEVWKEIPDYNGKYIASNLGRIRTTQEFMITPDKGIVKNPHFCKENIVGKGLSSKGYPRVNLNGKVVLVHQVIAKTFILNPENKPQVNHKDGNKLNNCVDNLEWVTNQENRDHAVKNGLQAKGERIPGALVSDQDRMFIIKSSKTNKELAKELAKEFSLKPKQIYEIRFRAKTVASYNLGEP